MKLPTRPQPRPIIKWTGGKFDEFSNFAAYIPLFANYYEPFFGGGGVFFALQPGKQAFLNDKSKDLISFYSLMQSNAFKSELLKYADAWHEAGKLSEAIIKNVLPSFVQVMQGLLTIQEFSAFINVLLDNIPQQNYPVLFDEAFIISRKSFLLKLKAGIADKCKRITNISKKEASSFNEGELLQHIETSVRSSLYLYLRSLTNLYYLGQLNLSKQKAAANWYFIREFCYASMFRFNAKGEFNIPYGGIAYNKKNFRQKVENIFAPQIKTLFKNAHFSNLDFEEFLAKATPAKGDFIFVDPPYDSEFSEYDQHSFTKADQLRLRNVLLASKANWMLIIKETEFIRELYTHEKCTLISFDKTYTYNVRGRNNRDTKHLIIINYKI